LEVLLRFQRVNVGVLLRLHTQELPVSSACAHSCYLWRTPDKHIRMYSCRLRLCSQNCSISFRRGWEFAKETLRSGHLYTSRKMQSIKKAQLALLKPDRKHINLFEVEHKSLIILKATQIRHLLVRLTGPCTVSCD